MEPGFGVPAAIRPGSWPGAGCLLVTIVFNVPENEALATVERDDADAPERWRDYVATWTA